jgi:ribonuclease D
MPQPYDYTLVDTSDALKKFFDENIDVEWLAVDTEFIGEKRFEVLLCLVQVASPKGFYLIDPLTIPDLSLFLQLLEDERILKITHAGENDYRLLNNLFGTIPKNIFDTQLAGGFIGHGYPASYGKLVEKELNVVLDKGYAATDWETRPLKKKQLDYALSDVLHLYDLYQRMSDKLVKSNRLSWLGSESKRWETPQYYDRDPHREALMNTMMQSLKTPKQIFLLRLYEWRRQEAQRLNHSKDMVLPSKYIAPILRGVESGKHALLDSRIIPDRLVTQHWDTFQKLYQKKVTDEELAILKRLPPLSKEDPKKDVSMDLLHGLVKYKCMESGVAPSLVLNKSDLTYAKVGEDIFNNDGNDWRREFLGEAMLRWLNERRELEVVMRDNEVVLKMKE